MTLFKEWQQRRLVSAATYFAHGEYRQCVRQLDALFLIHRASLTSWMPSLPEAAVTSVIREFAAPESPTVQLD